MEALYIQIRDEHKEIFKQQLYYLMHKTSFPFCALYSCVILGMRTGSKSCAIARNDVSVLMSAGVVSSSTMESGISTVNSDKLAIVH